MLRGHDRVNRNFGFLFLRVNHRRVARDGAMYRAAIEDHAVGVALVQATIKLLFSIAFGEKLRMANFNAVGEVFR